MESDCLQIPPFDPSYLTQSNFDSIESFEPDLGFSIDDDGGFELNFDDLDGIYFPSETESFLIPTTSTQVDSHPIDPIPMSFEDNSGTCDVFRDEGLDDVDKYLISCSSDSGSSSRELSQGSGVGCSNGVENLNCSSPVSSQGSGVSENVNLPSSPDSGNHVVDQKIKVEEPGKPHVQKRKKLNEFEGKDEGEEESRTSKYHKSSISSETTDEVSGLTNEEDEKRKARLMRNRESAQLSRQRKKHYVEELEDKVKAMHSTIADLNGKISYFMAENATLRQQLSGGAGICPPPPPGMYPHMAHMPYPWVPCSPYMVKPQGSQVPLIPIPRLKPQQPLSAPKSKKSDTKKSETKTKKVASISFLGLLFFMLLFGGLVPFMDVRNRTISENITDGFYDQHRGKTLTVNDHLNVSGGNMGDVGMSNTKHCEICRSGKSGYDTDQKEKGGGGSSSVHGSGNNTSEPLVASLYVPRNDKLVKIDGNLIIHSVLASEKAMASGNTPKTENSKETGLAIPRVHPRMPLADVRRIGEMSSHLFRNTNERQKALSSGSTDSSKENIKSSVADGKLQQWFREGLAGPMLSSGMCTEVFQFDVSPTSAPGAIIPAPSVADITVQQQQRQENATNLNRGRDRRILRGIPVSIPKSNLNMKPNHTRKNAQKENFESNKTASSTVVSVLVDPREVNDATDISAPKSLSRIFVVVLLDSVKYVTYSCGLPRSSPLVTT